MSIGQLRDGRWYVQYTRDGRTKREYFGRGPEAAQAASARHDELGLRKWTSSKRTAGISFGELAQAYMNSGATRMQDSTIDRLIRRLNTSILPQIGHHPAAAITPEVMDAYVLHRRRGGCSGTTCHGECALVKTILRWGKRRHHLELNPLDDYDLPKISTVPNPPPTIDEITRVYRVAPSHIKRAIALLWFLGLRGAGSELLGLRWEAVDWQAQTIQVTSARKGGPVSRRIRLHPALLGLMRQWASEDDCPYIVHWRGKRCRDVRATWRWACDRAGVRRFRPYDCRHAFATQILSSGGDLKTVQTLIGHASPALTLATYAHATQTASDRAVSLIPDTGFEVLPESIAEKSR